MLYKNKLQEYITKSNSPKDCIFESKDKNNETLFAVALRRIERVNNDDNFILGSIWKQAIKRVESLSPSLTTARISSWDEFKTENKSIDNFLELHFLANFNDGTVILASNSKDNLNCKFLELVFQNLTIPSRLCLYPDKTSIDRFKKKQIPIKDIEIGLVNINLGLFFSEENHIVKSKKYIIQLKEVENIEDPIALLSNIAPQDLDTLRIWDTSSKIIDLLNGSISFEEKLPIEEGSYNFDYVRTFLTTSYNNFKREYRDYAST